MIGPHERVAGLALLILSLALGSVGCATSNRKPVTRPQAPAGVHHVVQPGQTLWRIARTYGIELETLARANGIEDPSVLSAGRRLFIPGATALLDVPVPSRDAHSIEMNLVWPVENGRIISGYGAPRRTHRHEGLDIGGRHGQAVLASGPGRVVYSGATMRGYGKTIIIDHGRSVRTLYAHNSALLVREGDWVEQGETIARVGRTGNASADHCHFEVRRNDVPVDPLLYLSNPSEGTR